MLQKYFPILEEISSPLAMIAALQLSPEAAKIAVTGISNQVLETLLKEAIEKTVVYKKEIEVAASELEKARRAAAKESRALRFRAACAARKARAISKVARRVKAVKRPATKAALKACKGLNLDICRQRAANAQTAVYAANTAFNTAHEAALAAIQGGDVRTIRAAVAALKAATRLLEVRHLEFRFAREMLTISLARHSA